jgi:DNA damage-binding protein 2
VTAAGDSNGTLRAFDVRTMSQCMDVVAHRKSKITCVDAHPRRSELLLTTSNDHSMKMWDVRNMAAPVYTVKATRLLTSAYFSPITGSKILSTCCDSAFSRGMTRRGVQRVRCRVHPQHLLLVRADRIRVYGDVFGDVAKPTVEVIHSHEFARYLTPFRAVWDPKVRAGVCVAALCAAWCDVIASVAVQDITERRYLCGRYISDVFDGASMGMSRPLRSLWL